jgi:Sulfotransferase family
MSEERAPIWEQISRPFGVRVLNAVGSGLRRGDVRWPKITVDGLIRTARRRASLSDFGSEEFREGLGVFVDAFNGVDSAHTFGRFFFREYCTNLLVNRLKIQADLMRHPEILQVPIERPLMVTGLPRSGTTFLHRLLSEDPAGRTMRMWESLEPSPPPDPATYDSDPRIARARKKAALLYRLSPRLATAHEFSAESPEEDNNLFASGFVAGFNGFLFDVPDYMRWLDSQDLTPGYLDHKRQLQHLSWKFRKDYWILKAPAYQFGLASLLSVYPDANVVVTHRDPTQVMPSLCSLAAGFRGISTDRLDLRRLGDDFLEAIAVAPQRMIAARANADPKRFLDISYPQLVADPIGTVRSVCDHFGYAFTPEYEARARRYLAENPQHKHGVHHYSLSDFGLTPERVNAAFSDYRDWLNEWLPQGVLANSAG